MLFVAVFAKVWRACSLGGLKLNEWILHENVPPGAEGEALFGELAYRGAGRVTNVQLI